MTKSKAIKKRCITGKQVHISLESAHVFQKKLRKNWDILGAYQCTYCNGWHLGHAIGQKKKITGGVENISKLTESQKKKRQKAAKKKMQLNDLRNQDLYYSGVTK